MAEYFDQPKTIHVYQHEIGASNDWPEAVEALVEALKLREDDSAFPEFVRTLREVYNNGGGRVDVPRFDDPLMDDLVSAASRVSSGLAMMERLEQPFETVPKLCFTWAYIADLLMKIWPDEQPNFGEPIILPADPCHFDDPNARFLPPYMRVDAMLTAGLAIPRVGPTMDTLSPAPSSWVAMSPPNHGTPEDCTMDDVSCTSGHHGGKALRHRTAGSNGVQWDNDEAGASGEGLDQLDSRVDDDEFHSSASSADPFIEADEHPSWECANWTTTEVSFSEGSQRRVFDTESPSLTGVDAGDLQDAQEGEQEGEDDERPAYDGMAIDGVEDDDEFEDEDYDMQADGDIEADDDDDEPARESEADTPYEDAEEEAEPEEAVLAHTQLLFHARDDFIDLGLLCVASPEKMPYAMSSALLQRRAVGVMDPMVGIVFGKYSTRIRLVLGWTSVPADIDCVEVHIAYGDHSSLPCRALAAFDVRKPAEALELAYCLSALREHTAAMVQRAQEGLSSALARNLLRWRLDMAGRQHADPDLPALRTRVEAWRGAVACSPRQWARCRPSIREAKVLQCGGSSSLSTCSRTTTTSGMSNKKDTTTSKTSRTTQGAKSSASTSFPKRTFHNGRLNFVEEALKSDSSIQCVLPYGRSTPYSASEDCTPSWSDALPGHVI
ncbi:hypothetical protein BD626DRAFT_6767 [Schizophyllum amplum]|uniref:Uncharacterized protein n=1 Tax=Schizophyllum amplum TaxID=97359 RepID=A0A550CWJ0_9AGAR|nr:hypothetical protein BD626DRAFT_6767 [Auriculariopsis ampla]